MDLLWRIATRSSRSVTRIDGRICNRIKTNKSIWSRNELKQCCQTEVCTPNGLRKCDYARALLLLRALRRLETKCLQSYFGIKSRVCTICFEALSLPYFRHNFHGYHVPCIYNWITVSRKFTDPISRNIYSDAELARISQLQRVYHLDMPITDLVRFRNDNRRSEISSSHILTDADRVEIINQLLHEIELLELPSAVIESLFADLSAIDPILSENLLNELLATTVDAQIMSTLTPLIGRLDALQSIEIEWFVQTL